MNSRIDLQSELEAVLGSRNVYFQPPESIKIKYPAIVYSLGGINQRFANNLTYIKGKYYTVILIHNNPDNEIFENILDNFMYVNMERTYVQDNLYHYVFEIYY